MADSEAARRMATSLLDERTADTDDQRSWADNSSEVGEIFYRDLAWQWPGIPIQSPGRYGSSSRDMTRHQTGSLSMNRGSRNNFTIPEDLQGGFNYGLEPHDNERQRRDALPAHSQPHPALSPAPFQPPLPSLSPHYRQERIVAFPSTLEFYQQRNEMIARHHWKLTNQDMTFSNAQRCVRMLMKHHWKLLEFMEKLTSEGQTEPQLLDWLVREHRNLLDTSRLVLTYFERSRVPLLRG